MRYEASGGKEGKSDGKAQARVRNARMKSQHRELDVM